MNIETYIFGQFPSGYYQYPEDHTYSIFQKCYAQAQAITQIATYRKGDLMYYVYIHKLAEKRSIGLCVVLNGSYVHRPDLLFAGFEQIIEQLAIEGKLIHVGDDANLTTTEVKLYEHVEELNSLNHRLVNLFADQRISALPVSKLSVSDDAVRNYSISDSAEEIACATYTNGYTLIYKSKDHNLDRLVSYKEMLKRKNNEIADLKKKEKTLQKELLKWKRKQRNTKGVGAVAIVALILGVVVWNKVLFPDVVTNYNAGEYHYYGPMEGNKPHGVGVAIYRHTDKANRLYYYGNFDHGVRKDTSAIMFYRDGSYFKGEMYADKWKKGIFFDVDKQHFEGRFKDNKPDSGVWYKHVLVQFL